MLQLDNVYMYGQFLTGAHHIVQPVLITVYVYVA